MDDLAEDNVTADLLTHSLLGLMPVCCFLGALLYLDSYKLISIRLVLTTVLLGCGAALASYPANVGSLDLLGIEFVTYTRYMAPFVEEALKAAIIVVLLRHNRIGFLVDAAILGFAVGAGFAILENMHYLNILPDMQLGTWIVRGFGTAIMHGGATAIFAIVTRTLIGQHATIGLAALVPGFVASSIIHSIFNHFFLSPLISTLLIMACLPAVFVIVFDRSERSVSEWLGMSFDADTELLELINSGKFSTSKIGLYLHSLKQKFEGPVVADLLCYLRLHTELSIRAKGLLMMRESGFPSKAGEETNAKLDELRYLEGSIGTTGLLAIKPILRMSRKDLWQIYMLSAQSSSTRSAR